MSKFSEDAKWRYAGRCKNGTLRVEITNEPWFDSRYGRIQLRKGLLSDGGSVPRIGWPILSPFDTDMADPAFYHDQIYQDRDTKFSRWQADMILLDGCKAKGMPLWKRQAVFWLVRLAGWVVWNGYRQ